ncbi:MAG: rod shape-determining protein [Ruminococcaceae bacterium]|nr:rod shape-determining protein [Oscillospiraceae bacterium]
MDLGIDIGSSEIKIYADGKGVVLNEPAVVAIDTTEGNVIAYGKRARRMIGRNPDSITVVKPVKNGIIAGFDYCEYMLRRMIQKVCGNTMIKPKIVVAIPSILTNMDRLTIFDAVMASGARKVCLVEKPLLASYGAGIEFGAKRGSVVIDIGGGTMDTAVVTYGGLALHDALKIGGLDIDEAIMRYVYETYNIKIGERTAEEVKKSIGTAVQPKVEVTMPAKGLNINTGLPDIAELTNFEVYSILKEYLNKFAASLASILEQTPPELVADISLEGIHMCGGMCKLNGMAQFISDYIGIPAKLVPEPENCVARGTGVVFENAKELRAFGYKFRSFEREEPVGINENIYADD